MIVEADQTAQAFSGVLGQVTTPAYTPTSNDITDPRLLARHAVELVLKSWSSNLRQYGVKDAARRQTSRTEIPHTVYGAIVKSAKTWTTRTVPRVYSIGGRTYRVRDQSVARAASGYVDSALRSFNYYPAAVKVTPPLITEPTRPKILKNEVRDPRVYAEHGVRYTLKRLSALIRPEGVTNPVGKQSRRTTLSYKLFDRIVIDARKWIRWQGGASFPRFYNLEGKTYAVTHIVAIRAEGLVESVLRSYNYYMAEPVLTQPGYSPPTDRPPTTVVRPPAVDTPVTRPQTPEEKWGPVEDDEVQLTPTTPTAPNYYALIAKAMDQALASMGLRKTISPQRMRLTESQLRQIFSRMKPIILDKRVKHWGPESDRATAIKVVGYYSGQDYIKPHSQGYSLLRDRGYYVYSMPEGRPVTTPTATPTPTPTPPATIPTQRAEPIIAKAVSLALAAKRMPVQAQTRTPLYYTVYNDIESDAYAKYRALERLTFGREIVERRLAQSMINLEIGSRRYYSTRTPTTPALTPVKTPTITPVITPYTPMPEPAPTPPTETIVTRPPAKTPPIRRIPPTETIVTRLPTATPPITYYPPVTTPAGRATFAQLLRESVEKMLDRYRLPRTASQSSPYWLEDVRWNELVGDILAEANRLAKTEKYRQAQQAIYGGLSVSRTHVVQEIRRRYILPLSERVTTPTITPVTPAYPTTPRRVPTLDEWAATAPIFRTYEECAAAGQSATGRTPDRWRHCMAEDDAVSEAVSHALENAGIERYPGSLGVSTQQYQELSANSLDMAGAMVTQRTYSPMFGGSRLAMFRESQ